MARKESFPADQPKSYWFSAKQYGWGWGLPLAWQGWVVLISYAIGMFAAGTYLPAVSVTYFVAAVIVMTALLIWICWLKGEPPRWRWGKDDNHC